MKPKPRKYTLHPLMFSVEVKSFPNGHLSVQPRWKKGIYPPGVQTRLAAAMRLADLINGHLGSKR